MTRILAITSSPNPQTSVSNELVDRFVETRTAQDPLSDVTRRDIGVNPPPHIDAATIGAFYTPDESRSDEQNRLIALSDALVSELEQADVVVIGSPMHNFSISSGLKAWIDHVARVGRTFRYTDKGPEGLLTDKKVFVLTARGGNYSEGSPARHLDHQEPYLRTALGFIGLDDVTFIHAHGVVKGDAGKEMAVAEIERVLASVVDRVAA